MKRDEADAELQGFFADVDKAAAAHRLLATLTVAVAEVEYEKGPGRAMAVFTTGDRDAQPEAMAAFAYGRCSAERRAHVNQLLAGKAI